VLEAERKVLEAPIKRKIYRYLRTLPDSDWEISPPGSNSGKPDITGCIKGRYVGFEVKSPTGRASKLQVYRLKKLGEAQAIVAVVRSVDEARTALLHAGLL
jgi:hypothetical protein